MIVPVLLCLIGIFAWCQPSAARRKTALLYATPTLMFTLVSGLLSDEWYYMGAALIDSLTIILLSWLVVVDKLAVRLMILSAISMSLNIVGLVMYEMHQPATFYDALFIALYIGVIIAIVDQECSNVGMGGAGRLHPGSLRNAGSSIHASHQSDSQI
jgi:hypothetical protein